MMRRALVIASLLFACSRGGARAGFDLATGTASAAAPVTSLSCRALDGCTAACATAACAEACVKRLSAPARPVYEALQACVVPACVDADAGAPCATPGSFACKMCVLGHCGSQAAACLRN